MFEREISVDEVAETLQNGKVIEKYSGDKPFPSF
jgi:hypothetical protein